MIFSEVQNAQLMSITDHSSLIDYMELWLDAYQGKWQSCLFKCTIRYGLWCITIVFSVFNFQFSVFSNNKFNPNTPDNCFFEEFQTYSSETNHRGDLDQRVHFIVAVYSNHEAPVIIILLNLQTKFEKSRKSVRPI